MEQYLKREPAVHVQCPRCSGTGKILITDRAHRRRKHRAAIRIFVRNNCEKVYTMYRTGDVNELGRYLKLMDCYSQSTFNQDIYVSVGKILKQIRSDQKRSEKIRKETMPCIHMKMPDGTPCIVKVKNLPRRRCYFCAAWSTCLCDGPGVGRKSCTCDRRLCPAHAHHVEPDKDYCPEHKP